MQIQPGDLWKTGHAHPTDPSGSRMPLLSAKEAQMRCPKAYVRPTNHRIAQLELENARLRQSQNTDSEESFLPHATSSLSPISPRQARVTTSTPQDDDSLRSNSHPEVPDGDNSNRRAASLYHGPTSTAYDDTARSGNGIGNDEMPHDPASEEWARNVLFVQTARQRQLEPLNLAARRLDFDGLDPEIGMHLLSIYWSRQLYTAQIIYRPVFMRDMACAGPYFSKLLLNAILFTVSKHCSRSEIRSNPDDITTAGWRFRQRFTELLRESFDKSKITTIQALLIMSNSLFSRCDERSLSWLYAGNAFNMIIDLGLHVASSDDTMNAEELEIRKRVLWGAYSIDKIQCLFQGRPPLLRHTNIKALLKFLDEYDEMDTFQAITYKQPGSVGPAVPSLNVSLLTKLCELSVIIDRIMCELYSESAQAARGQSEDISENINLELCRWRQSLPPELDYLSYPSRAVLLPQAFCLLALFNVLIILSKRPLFTGKDERPNNPGAAFESINTCTTAANQIVQILRDYSQHFAIRTAPYMLSYATYISATIHARIVAQKGRTSSSFQSLVLCRNVIQEHQPLYGAAGKAKGSLDRLCDHLGVNVGDESGRIDTTNSVLREPLVVSGPVPPLVTSNVPQQTLDLSSQLNWELSDLDLEAIAQGFRFDGDLDYLMNPVGM
ncbi:hypothetical protein N7532_009330 [Penicillium argentinense]|uniref:Xylanolytic transcriptional activator regulatory domain-containing protein n=1 Tax=Penicillium argentinense TaxID=1131581 RepID=A0A9W9K2V9_9EURO|nr:uncharacterized protein N7532_009330 [Penicillium argentinense]KAJ5090646.1 hypothetical protein N7532_009330 [Penicillium argentinense]